MTGHYKMTFAETNSTTTLNWVQEKVVWNSSAWTATSVKSEKRSKLNTLTKTGCDNTWSTFFYQPTQKQETYHMNLHEVSILTQATTRRPRVSFKAWKSSYQWIYRTGSPIQCSDKSAVQPTEKAGNQIVRTSNHKSEYYKGTSEAITPNMCILQTKITAQSWMDHAIKSKRQCP